MESQLLTVEIYLIFRLIVFTADVHFAYTFHLQEFTLQFGSQTVGSFEIIAIDFEVGSGLTTHTATATAEEHLSFVEFRVELQVFTHFVTYLFQADFTVNHTHQADIE